MSDLNQDGAMLKELAGNIQVTKFQIGTLVAARLATKEYGEDTAGELARVSGLNKRSLWEYSSVAQFIHRLVEFEGWKGKPEEFYADHPAISHTHARVAQPVDKLNADGTTWDMEDSIDALLAVTNGDDRYPKYSESLPMSADAFLAYVGELKGRAPKAVNKGVVLTGDIKDILNASDEPALWVSCGVDDPSIRAKALQLITQFLSDSEFDGNERIEFIVRVLPPEKSA